MTRVLAAVDASAATCPVLQEAQLFGDLIGATSKAIYVGRRGKHASRLAEHVGVPIRVLHGSPAAVILHEAAADDVALAVVGARGLPSGRSPFGHVTRRVLQQLPKGVVVVPPDFAPIKLAHILVPLDGTYETGLAIARATGLFARGGSDFVVMHTLTPDTMPTMLDHAGALDIWAQHFLRRLGPELADARVEVRVGAPGANASEFTRVEPIDLIVLVWRRTFAGQHGQVVKDVLAHSGVPVLLLPMDVPMTEPFRRGSSGTFGTTRGAVQGLGSGEKAIR